MADDHCFFERQPGHALARRASAEGIGTLMLVLVAAGATMALQVSPQPSGAAGLVALAFAVSGALAGLIVAIGPISGGHFNPLITVVQWLAHERRTDCMLAYVAAQVVGGVVGAALANALHAGAVHAPSLGDIGHGELLSELIATAGLMIIVQACSRTSASEGGPFAVAAWLGGAMIATPTLSLANPAIVAAALVADGPLALNAEHAGAFMLTQVWGALIAYAVVRWVYPRSHASSSDGRSAMHDQGPVNS